MLRATSCDVTTLAIRRERRGDACAHRGGATLELREREGRGEAHVQGRGDFSAGENGEGRL